MAIIVSKRRPPAKTNSIRITEDVDNGLFTINADIENNKTTIEIDILAGTMFFNDKQNTTMESLDATSSYVSITNNVETIFVSYGGVSGRIEAPDYKSNSYTLTIAKAYLRFYKSFKQSKEKEPHGINL